MSNYFPLFDQSWGMVSSTYGTCTVTGTVNAVGLTWREDKGRTVSGICFNVSANVGTPFLRGMLVVCDTSGYRPVTGTLLGTNTQTNTFSPTTGWNFVPLLVTGAITPGTTVGAVLMWVSGGAQTTINYGIQTLGIQRIPSCTPLINRVWTLNNFSPNISVKFTDGTYLDGCFNTSRLTSQNISTASNPMIYGMEWQQQYNINCIGFKGSIRPLNPNSNFSINLYKKTSNSVNTPIASSLINGGATTSVTAWGMLETRINPVQLIKGQTYILGIEPVTTGTYARIVVDFVDANSRDCVVGPMSGVNAQNPTGTWTYSVNGKDCFNFTPVVDIPTFESYRYF